MAGEEALQTGDVQEYDEGCGGGEAPARHNDGLLLMAGREDCQPSGTIPQEDAH